MSELAPAPSAAPDIATETPIINGVPMTADDEAAMYAEAAAHPDFAPPGDIKGYRFDPPPAGVEPLSMELEVAVREQMRAFGITATEGQVLAELSYKAEKPGFREGDTLREITALNGKKRAAEIIATVRKGMAAIEDTHPALYDRLAHGALSHPQGVMTTYRILKRHQHRSK